MLDLILFRIKTNQIIVLIVPSKRPGADFIELILSPLHLLIQIPAQVLEANLLIIGYGIMDIIDDVVNALIHRLDPSLYHHLPLKL